MTRDAGERGRVKAKGRWKFGVGQSVGEERAEIRAAMKAGSGTEYMAGQRFRDLIAAEGERKRKRRRELGADVTTKDTKEKR